MCQSLAQLGHHVTLMIGRKPWRMLSWTGSWTRYFGFQPSFNVRRFWELPRTGFWFDRCVANCAQEDASLVYLRYPRLLPSLCARRVPAILELHSRLTPTEAHWVAASLGDGHLLGVVAITEGLRQNLCGMPELSRFAERVMVASDAVDLSRFADFPSPLDLGRAGYVGSLYAGKGMELIAQLAKFIPQVPIDVFGGNRSDRKKWAQQITATPNLQLHGPVAPAAVPACLKRFGIALLPNQPRVQLPNGDDIGQFTSPMKLFEYMAAGRVILASDLPTLREVLQHERNCLLVRHDSPKQWADAIERIQTDQEFAQRLASQARHDAVTRYSYRARFERILAQFLEPHVLNQEIAA